MIYEANTTQWPIGALVIHDGDDKKPYMLMRVGSLAGIRHPKDASLSPSSQQHPQQWARPLIRQPVTLAGLLRGLTCWREYPFFVEIKRVVSMGTQTER